MFCLKTHHIIWLLALIFILNGCSKNAQEENFLENYYRTAAKGDAQALSEYIDFSMFKASTASDRGMVMYMVQSTIDDMDKLFNANGELKKVSVKNNEAITEDNKPLLLITCDLEFKNGRTITKKEVLSRPNGKLKIFLVKEEIGLW